MPLTTDATRCAPTFRTTTTTGKMDYNTGQMITAVTHPITGETVAIKGTPAQVAAKLDYFSELWKEATLNDANIDYPSRRDGYRGEASTDPDNPNFVPASALDRDEHGPGRDYNPNSPGDPDIWKYGPGSK